MIFFKLVNEAYVNVGTYKIQRTYAEGYNTVQGLGSQGGNEAPIRTLEAKPMPEYFNLDWAQFVYPTPLAAATDAVQAVGLYDKGAYGVGTKVFDKTTLDVPRFRKVTMLYKHDTSVTNESRELVQFDPREYQPVTVAGVVLTAAQYLALLLTQTFSEQEYYAFLAVQGFNRYGTVYPAGVSKSVVSELSSLRGDLVSPVTGETLTAGVVIYVTPMNVQNSRPLFDAVYMENEELVEVLDATGALVINPSNVTQMASRLVRFRGGFVSDSRAPINYNGASLPTGSGYAGFEPVFPRQGIVINGVTYINSDEFNVVNKPLG